MPIEAKPASVADLTESKQMKKNNNVRYIPGDTHTHKSPQTMNTLE